MEEKNYYSIVKDFLLKEFKCFYVETEVGVENVGRIDVVGLRDIGGRYSGEIEIISVEVKKSTKSPGKKMGQALAYSVLANRCYLAAPGEFSMEHREIANRLGIGLIEIKDKTCSEKLTSKFFEPIEALSLRLLRRKKINYRKCTLCGSVVKDIEIKRRIQIKDVGVIRPLLFTKQKKEKQFKFVNLCENCTKVLKQIKSQEEKDGTERFYFENITGQG